MKDRKYQIFYMGGDQETVTARRFATNGEFVDFFRKEPADVREDYVVLRVRASVILQVAVLPDEEDS